jgi:hypothetical protein
MTCAREVGMTEPDIDLEGFVRGEADSGKFPHEQHVRMGFEMLRRHDFAETAHLYSRALRTMTQRMGRPEIFHQTVTIAFLSIIAERMRAQKPADFAEFAAGNSDLFEQSVLSRYYRPERLASDIARSSFVLPDPEIRNVP